MADDPFLTQRVLLQAATSYLGFCVEAKTISRVAECDLELDAGEVGWEILDHLELISSAPIPEDDVLHARIFALAPAVILMARALTQGAPSA